MNKYKEASGGRAGISPESPIAFFDSGAGGLSVLRAVRRLLPGENCVYFGDRLHAPYGSKSHAEIRSIAAGNARMLFGLGAKALVVACNTATAAAVDHIREIFPDRIVIGIEPAVKPAFEAGCRRVAVLATPATVAEERFGKLLGECSAAFGGEAVGVGCPGLSTMIEEGKVTEDYFRPLLAGAFPGSCPDGIVLGCTHYPFAACEIRSASGGLPVFDGAEGTARQTKRRLEAEGLLNPAKEAGRLDIIGDDGGFIRDFWRVHCG